MRVMSVLILQSDKLSVAVTLACEVLQVGLWGSAIWLVKFCNLACEVLQFGL